MAIASSERTEIGELCDDSEEQFYRAALKPPFPIAPRGDALDKYTRDLADSVARLWGRNYHVDVCRKLRLNSTSRNILLDFQ
jgi:hypothetical protein